MTSPTFTLYLRDGSTITFESAFDSVGGALTALTNRGAPRNEFEASLRTVARDHLDGFAHLSETRAAWLHKLATDAVRPATAPEAGEIDCTPILRMFETASAGGKHHPRIRLANTDGAPVVLKHKRDGGVSITDGRPFGSSVYYGSVTPEGHLRPSRAFRFVAPLIVALAQDPLATVAAYGRITGSCSFCGRPLTAKDSVDAGYGPICAEKFGLSYGRPAVAAEEVSQ